MKAHPKKTGTKKPTTHQLEVDPADPEPLPPKRANTTVGRVYHDTAAWGAKRRGGK